MTDVNLNEGTVSLKATVMDDPEASEFDFFNFSVSKGRISLEIRDRNKLTFTHVYNGMKNRIIHDFSDYFNKQTQLSVTWNVKVGEMRLFINGQLVEKKDMNLKLKV